MAPQDFSKAVIYKIVCKDRAIKDVFVDSTSNLENKIQTHKTTIKAETPTSAKHQLTYSTIRAHGGLANWDFVWIENFPCNNKHELNARVWYWIELLDATLNRAAPGPAAPKPALESKNDVPTCPCGSFVKIVKHSSHINSKKHQDYLREQLLSSPANGMSSTVAATSNAVHEIEPTPVQTPHLPE